MSENIQVLCFNCGLSFYATYETANLTKQCPNCKNKLKDNIFETQVDFE